MLRLYKGFGQRIVHFWRCLIFGGLQDKEVSLQQLEAWRSHTIAAYNLQMFSGDHFFIQSQQSLLLESLAEDLQALI